MREILLADDELFIRRGIDQLLKEYEGYRVAAQARNGAEALSLFAKLLPDIVVMDIQMPELNGLDTFEHMRKIQSHTQGIFISAFSEPMYLRTAIRHEAVDYLFKPIDPDELMAALARADARLTQLGVAARHAHAQEGRDAASQRAVQEIQRLIQSQYANPLSVQTIAEAVHLSSAYACTLYKRCTGDTILHYLTEVRLEAALHLLRSTDLPIYAVAQRVGYQDYRYFKQLFERRMHRTPAQYRKEERG